MPSLERETFLSPQRDKTPPSHMSYRNPAAREYHGQGFKLQVHLVCGRGHRQQVARTLKPQHTMVMEKLDKQASAAAAAVLGRKI